MNEEISTPETAVELDTDIVKATLVARTVNGEQMITWAVNETTTEITESTTPNTAEKGEE